jgi:hypothetical protein
MISEEDWIDNAEDLISDVVKEIVQRLETEANEIWKGKRVCGETQLGPTRSPYDGPIHRVAVSQYEDPNDGPCVSLAFYAMVTFPFGTVEMYVHDPRFPDEMTP